MMLTGNSFVGSPLAHRAAILVAVCAALQACGGGGGDAATGQVGPGSGNQAPTITGSPATAASVGQAYSFAPQASDANGDSLTFSVQNLPSWASFDARTGRISGTPPANGQFANITISVSDGQASTSLAPYTLTVSTGGGGGSGVTGSAALSWQPPTIRTDGSTLTDLTGYRIRYGTAPDTYTTTVSVDNPGLTSYVIDNLPAGTYYFVVTAVDSTGAESSASNGASKTIG